MPLIRFFPPQQPSASPKADQKQTNEPPKQKKRPKPSAFRDPDSSGPSSPSPYRSVEYFIMCSIFCSLVCQGRQAVIATYPSASSMPLSVGLVPAVAENTSLLW